MNAKLKCGILAFAICVVVTGEKPVQAVEDVKKEVTEEQVNRAVVDVKSRGDKKEVRETIKTFERSVTVSEKLLPTFHALLKEKE